MKSRKNDASSGSCPLLVNADIDLFSTVQQLSPRLAASRSRSRRKSRSAGSVHNLKDFLPWELWHFGTHFVSLHIIGRPRSQLCPHPNTRSQPAGDCRKLAEVEKEAESFSGLLVGESLCAFKKSTRTKQNTGSEHLRFSPKVCCGWCHNVFKLLLVACMLETEGLFNKKYYRIPLSAVVQPYNSFIVLYSPVLFCVDPRSCLNGLFSTRLNRTALGLDVNINISGHIRLARGSKFSELNALRMEGSP